MKSNFLYSALWLMIAALAVSGCSKNKFDSDAVEPIESLYKKGSDLLEQGKYQKAAEAFEQVFFQHPGNIETPRSELMQAYSLYLAGEYGEAQDVLEMFIKLHPVHENIAYAYYLRGLASYAQISNVKFDQSATGHAQEYFKELITKFPATKYATDAQMKMDLIKDHLAGKEMLVGRFYLKDNNPIAAIKRFQIVITEYPYTIHVEEALYRMVESTSMLGLTDEAKKYLEVLHYNYPEGKWYERANKIFSKISK